ncbi:hypothetical protein HMPREF2952_02500 [Neisseria sp. HMSC068C12]|uniref:Uncharacterized protein n=1 Tax=Morococcus cerebrosus TaxID=1056807 RepID=A0A0C1H620_9NEIS|nr:hypothetical protein MCC93_00920 [Morococcus cerebrosus]OFQ12268.1 hypothetical protein HMPREF2952_02500 [Neisseria sp. HMSC068C12]
MKIFVAGRLNGFQTAFAVCCVCLGAAWFLWRPIQTAFFIFCWVSTQPALLPLIFVGPRPKLLC